eukprot:TRINITY_DN230_c2_g3_i1.p1 TRINITY_DN230_c2_g3~~TRINITY_DN230_c2_g3_i1.p1  ORF type:complete len:172 (+),score=30.29 TRINITY_DN230_c2_g3_i1:38-553(+)
MANSSEESTNDQQSSQPELTRELSGYYGDNEMIELSRGHSDTLMLSTDVHLDAVFAPDYTIPVSLTVLTDDQLNGILTDMGISEDTVNMFNRLQKIEEISKSNIYQPKQAKKRKLEALYDANQNATQDKEQVINLLHVLEAQQLRQLIIQCYERVPNCRNVISELVNSDHI